jgi:hypothetical protein
MTETPFGTTNTVSLPDEAALQQLMGEPMASPVLGWFAVAPSRYRTRQRRDAADHRNALPQQRVVADLFRRVPPALFRCNVVTDSSCLNIRATELSG